MKVCKHAQIWSKLLPLRSKFGSIQFWIVSPQFAQLEWFGHDLQVQLVKLEQILHLKVDCSDFDSVWDRGSLPWLVTVNGQISNGAEN